MNPYAEYGVYIAGPECFYPRGYSLWHAQRKLAEYYGFTVVLPNDFPLKLDHEDLRKNADEIFANLREVIKETKIIIADLELFRSSEPDCGTLFELGMSHAVGALLYGYTRDKRTMVNKNQYCHLDHGKIKAQDNQEHRYADLPYAPSVIASTMLVEGDFHDCIKVVMMDLDERRKQQYHASITPQNIRNTSGTSCSDTGAGTGRPRIFLSGPTRYLGQANEIYMEMKKLCEKYGFEGVAPSDGVPDLYRNQEDPLIRACMLFDHWQSLLRSCDIFVGDLNDYHGWEPCNDTAFEAGVAWKLDKECYAYMEDTRIMRERIPNIEGYDVAGNIVENFNYPINLMFSCSMPIIEGDFETVLRHIAVSHIN